MVTNSLEKGYNIALHCIREPNNSKEIAEKIMEEGLNIPTGRSSILSTAISLGDPSRNNNIQKYIEEYRFGSSSEGYNVIIKTPTVIKNSKGERIFLGDPGVNTITSSQEYEATCILDLACAKLGKIPSEFIFGYRTPDGKTIQNPNHYLKLSDNRKDEMDNLFDTIKESLSTTALSISEAILNKDYKSLEKYKELIKIYNLNNLLKIIDNSEKQINSHSNIDNSMER